MGETSARRAETLHVIGPLGFPIPFHKRINKRLYSFSDKRRVPKLIYMDKLDHVKFKGVSERTLG